MAEFASLPLFTDSWMADTGHLSRAERGLYMDLLILCWRSPDCRVPNDIEWVSRKLRCSPEEQPMLQQVLAEFMSSDGNFLSQKRLRQEFIYVRKKHQKQSASAKSRWNKDKKSKDADADRVVAGNANAMPPHPHPQEEDKSSSMSNVKEAQADLNWQDFVGVYPKRAGGDPLPPAKAKFMKLVRDGEDPSSIIAGAERYRDFCIVTDKVSKEYVKQKITWLNQRMWEDPYDPPKQRETGRSSEWDSVHE